MAEPVTIVMVRGAGEIPGSAANMLADVVGRLPLDRLNVIELPYAASVGPGPGGNVGGPSLNTSVQQVRSALSELCRLTQVDVIIGYSLGALAVSMVLEDIAAVAPYTDGMRLPSFVGFLANPARARQVGLPGYGIHHEHGAWPLGPVYREVANADDGITCCPDPSPLRTLTDQVDAFSFAEMGGWSSDMVRRLVTGRWQPSAIDLRDPFGTFRRYTVAAQLMQGYLDGTAHVQWYRDHGVQTLAQAITEAVGL